MVHLMKKDKKVNLLKNTVILSFGTLCTKGIMFILTPLLTLWLTQDEYGTFDLLLTYVSLLIPFITLDIGEAAFRFLMDADEQESFKKKIISSAFFTTLLGLILSFFVVLLIYFLQENVRHFIFSFFILLVCESFYTYNTFIIRGLKKLPIYAVSNIIFVFSMAVLSYLFARVLSLGLNGILIAYSLGYFISILYALIQLKLYRFCSIKFVDFELLKKMAKFSLPLMPNSISWWIMNVSDRTIVSFVLGTSTNAIYAVANKIPNLCQTFFSVFHLSWQENAIETMKDEDRDAYYSSVMNNMIKILSSICILILASNFLIYQLFFDDRYFLGYYQVPILVIALMLSMLAQFIGGIYIAQMKSKKNGFTTIVTAIVNLIVHLVLIHFIGLYAATVSTLISYVLLFMIRYIDIKKDINLRFNRETLINFGVILYIFVASYLNILVLNWINLVMACFYFIISNRMYFSKILNKFKFCH